MKLALLIYLLVRTIAVIVVHYNWIREEKYRETYGRYKGLLLLCIIWELLLIDLFLDAIIWMWKKNRSYFKG